MYAHKHRISVGHITLDQSDMLQSVVFLAEGNQMEETVVGGKVDLFATLHYGVVFQTIGDEVADGDKLESPLVRASAQFGESGHGAVVAHDLHQHGAGMEPGEARQIHTGLCVAGALEHTAVLRVERVDVTRPAEILGLRLRIGEMTDRIGAVGDADACRAALQFVDCHREGGAQHRGVVAHLTRQVEATAGIVGQRHAEHAPRILEHEIDHLGGHFLRRRYEVALILAVLVVDDYHKFAVVDIFKSIFDAVKSDLLLHMYGGLCCLKNREIDAAVGTVLDESGETRIRAVFAMLEDEDCAGNIESAVHHQLCYLVKSRMVIRRVGENDVVGGAGGGYEAEGVAAHHPEGVVAEAVAHRDDEISLCGGLLHSRHLRRSA